MLHGLFLLSLCLAVLASPLASANCGGGGSTPGTANCTERYFTNYVDHFAWHAGTYEQRYFVFDAYYRPGGPILFYTGNEADVELYVNCTGLMWENAADLQAMLVFAEHRFFGKSLPCSGGYRACGAYLSPDQALADYAMLIHALRQAHRPSAVIAFGGSYGGMLTAWMRMRYPALVDGGIAASAPLLCLSPAYDKKSYWAAVTRDATSFAGAPEHCAQRVSAAFAAVQTFMQTDTGRMQVQQELHTCSPLTSDDTTQLLLYLQAAFDNLAMGNYPFPTSYICGSPTKPCPAWPMRVACGKFDSAADTEKDGVTSLRQLYEAISVVFNATGSVPCFNISGESGATYSLIWDYLVCTSGIVNEQPYFPAAGWPNDMFWAQEPWNSSRLDAHCLKAFQQVPREGYLDITLGAANLPAASNLVLSNGLLDPWHTGGILHDVSSSVVAVIIPEGAHHLDLMFSHPMDPPSVRMARAKEMSRVRQWITAAARRRPPRSAKVTLKKIPPFPPGHHRRVITKECVRTESHCRSFGENRSCSDATVSTFSSCQTREQ